MISPTSREELDSIKNDVSNQLFLPDEFLNEVAVFVYKRESELRKSIELLEKTHEIDVEHRQSVYDKISTLESQMVEMKDMESFYKAELEHAKEQLKSSKQAAGKARACHMRHGRTVPKHTQ